MHVGLLICAVEPVAVSLPVSWSMANTTQIVRVLIGHDQVLAVRRDVEVSRRLALNADELNGREMSGALIDAEHTDGIVSAIGHVEELSETGWSRSSAT